MKTRSTISKQLAAFVVGATFAISAPASADVVLQIKGFQMGRLNFVQMVGARDLVGELNSISVDATISGSVSQTYAQDLCVYLDVPPLNGGGELQVGGFTPISENGTHAMWPTGDFYSDDTPVSGTVVLAQPVQMSKSELAIYVGNGYGTPRSSAEWNGTITLHGVDWVPSLRDDDGDGLMNTIDNCPFVANEQQTDCDNDGIGDVCDADMYADCNNDGIADNCQNDLAADINQDGRLDACQYAFGDLDLSGIVDGVDLGLMLVKWGQPNPGIPDCNGDDIFDGLDLGILLVHWGSPS
jgi:hypothetical protein